MAQRMIRDGWLESDRIDALDVHAERFFIRLCLKADDFGRFHASPQLLKSMLFPLKEDIRSTDMTRCLAECEKAGLVRCYEVAGKRYLEINNFGQRLRTMSSKFPQPADNPPQSADNCPQPADNPPPEEKRSRKEGEGEEKERSSPPLDFENPTPEKFNPNRIATFDQVMTFGKSQPMPISDECCEAFFDRMEAEGWVTPKGLPLADWRARFRSWATNWANNAAGRAKR